MVTFFGYGSGNPAPSKAKQKNFCFSKSCSQTPCSVAKKMGFCPDRFGEEIDHKIFLIFYINYKGKIFEVIIYKGK